MNTAMVISPHADDAAAFCGATIAKFADQGWKVILVRVTDDRKDSVGLSIEVTIQKNAHELREAARILGIHEIVELAVARAAFASHISQFQVNMANVLTSIIFSGVLERFPRIRLVLGESGVGWIPYVLWRMDAEWEDQFKDLSLKMPPSGYWKRQCWATYQTDPIGIKLADELGVDKIMWGSDFPHPDGVWPDSQEYIQRELGHLPAGDRRKIVCENAAALYGFAQA